MLNSMMLLQGFAQSPPPPPAIELPPWLLLIAAALAVVLLWRTLAPPRWREWPWRSPSQRSRDPLSHPAPPSLAQQRSVERDVQALMHELLEMSRKIVQQLDAKSARLQELMKQADARIEHLAEMEKRAATTAAKASREEASPPPIPPANAKPHSAPEPEISIQIDPRHEQVYLLEDEGLSAMQISNRLNMPEGEVELILALRPRRRAAI
jgi:hypothetical protein